jgi:hypothetical protein
MFRSVKGFYRLFRCKCWGLYRLLGCNPPIGSFPATDGKNFYISLYGAIALRSIGSFAVSVKEKYPREEGKKKKISLFLYPREERKRLKYISIASL